jgi:beta-glucanase (GH16 family)
MGGAVALIAATSVAQTPFTEHWTASSSPYFAFIPSSGSIQSNVADGSATDGRIGLLTISASPAPGPGGGPNLESHALYGFGTYEARLKTADCSSQPNTGIITGFFTFLNDGTDQNGNGISDNSEIDFEWLCAEPNVIWVTLWTDYHDPTGQLRRVYRELDLATGTIRQTCYSEGFGQCTQNLAGSSTEGSPSSITPIPGYNSATAYYTYGFTWQSNRVTWYIYHPTTGAKITLWDYQGPTARITQRPAHYMLNVWHTNNWTPPGMPGAVQPPNSPRQFRIDTVTYSTSSATPTATARPTATATARPTATATATGTLRPTATATSVPGGNLALNRPAVASSIEGAGFEAAKAVDGNAATRWASVEPAPGTEWIYVDLGSPTSVSRVVLSWEAAYATSYQVQVSADAVNWTSIYTTTTGNGAIDDLAVSGTGRYVRVHATVRATAYGYSLWALEVYGAGGPTPTARARPTATMTATATTRSTATATARPTATATTRPTATATTRPTATSTAVPGGNLALGKPAAASSIEGAGFEAAKAVDGSATTRWASVEPAPGTEWIYVDLGASYTVGRVVLNWEAAYATSYQVQVSSDAANWTSIYATTTGNGAIDDLAVSGTGRYVRLWATVRATAYGYSLWAFEVYGAGGTTPTATARPSARATATATVRPTPTPTSPAGWNLVWSDEFNGPSIDMSNWTFIVSGEGGGNNERQYYTNGNNASIVADTGADGTALLIEARRETGNTCWYGPCQYTSARMVTEGKRSWQYGKIEARLKLPYGNGLWPAFWAMGSTGDWPACGEIDIMELVGGTQCGSECGDNHTHGYMWWSDNGDKSDGAQGVNLPSGRYADAYHVFGVEWDAQQIRWFVDGQPLVRADNGQPLALSITGSGKTEFHQPFYLLLNIAVGGAWPLDPPASSVFPQRMYVDWVRVYQK